MKTYRQLFAERVMSVADLLKLNNKPKYDGVKSMLTVLENDENSGYFSDFIKTVDLTENIIMCVPDEEDIVSMNIDGTFSIKPLADINLSSQRTIQNGRLVVYTHFPKIKFCIPQGMKLQIDDPSFGLGFFEKIYVDCKTFYNKQSDDSKFKDFDSSLPSHYLITNLQLTFNIDINRLKSISQTAALKKTNPISNLFFLELPHFASGKGIKHLKNIVLIKDTEVFRDFLNVF